MTVRAATVLTFVFLITMMIAVTWPGLTLFNRIEPRILGLPFNFAWVSGWIVASFFVLLILERATSNEVSKAASERASPIGSNADSRGAPNAAGSGSSPSDRDSSNPDMPSRGEP